MKRNILHITLGPLQAGAPRLIRDIIKYSDHSLFNFDVLTLNEHFSDFRSPYANDIEELGGEYIKIYKERIRHHFRFCKQIDEALSRKPYSAIHLHASPGEWQIPLFGYYAQRHGIPKRILHSHSQGMVTYNNAWAYKVYSAFIKRFYPPRFTHRLACSTYAGCTMFGESTFKIVKNGIELERFKYDETLRRTVRERYGISSNAYVIGHVGRFDIGKNQSFLVDIFQSLQKVKPGAYLLLIGDGPSRPDIEAKARALPSSDKIIFVGMQDATEYYNAMDAFILPSLYEGMPLVVVEAQTSGLPCIVSDTVTPEVKVLDTTHFQSLAMSPETWVADLPSMPVQDTRKDAFDTMKNANWSIQSMAKTISDIYLEE